MSNSPEDNNEYVVDDPTPEAPDRVLTAARVWTGARHDVIADAALVIRDRAIAWVGPRRALPVEYSALPHEDHANATMIPGLIEVHAHLGGFAYNYSPSTPDPDRINPGWHALSSLVTARQLASLGVTTVQSLGARHFADVALREAIELGIVEGPRIVASGPQITTTGGHSWATGGEVDGIIEIVHRIREHHKAGVDTIKVMATGGFGTYGSAPWNAQFTQEELDVLVAEAHRLGKNTAAHAHGTQGIERAVHAGIDLIAHGSFIDVTGETAFDPRLADEMAERGTYVDITSPPSFPPVEGETATPRAKELFDHGVRLATGNDIGAVLPPSGYIFTLHELEASGIPREDVLLAATSNAAAASGLAGVTGVLRQGYSADMLIVDGNPLDDLSALDHLDQVIIQGHVFRRDHVDPFTPSTPHAKLKVHAHAPSGLDARSLWVEHRNRAIHHPGA